MRREIAYAERPRGRPSDYVIICATKGGDERVNTTPCQGLSLLSGGLDSRLAVRVLERAGAKVECVAFSTPFFDDSKARAAAAALGVKLHVIDFLDDEISLIEKPPHGFGGAMNPCIDCHALMIRRAGELMERLGFDFVATGEVRGQRPMSQNAQSLVTVEKASGLAGRLVRPLSAKLLPPTIPEQEGKLDREKLLDISGRSRERQIALAAEFGIKDYPSPAGGCRNRKLVELLSVGRRFRLPDGSGVVLGRDAAENAALSEKSISEACGAAVLSPPQGVVGPVAMMTSVKSDADLDIARQIVLAWSRGTTEDDRRPYKRYQLT